MAKKLVKYKLIKFGNGYVCPPGIIDGGNIWESSNSVENTILVGTYDVKPNIPLADGIIETITKKQWDARIAELSDANLTAFKQKAYEMHTDPLFIEALRDKEAGNLDKWNAYLSKCKKIHDLEVIPEDNIIKFD